MTSRNLASVLLIDEGQTCRVELNAALAELGGVLRLAGGAESVALAGSGAFALVLAATGDTGAGIDLLKRLHDATRVSKTPIIALASAAAACPHTLEACYMAGAIDILTVPLQPYPLRTKLHYFLDAYRRAGEHRRSEAALSDIRARLEATLAEAELATWSWDVQADRVSADAAMARLFNISPAEADGSPLAFYLAALHPDDVAPVRAAVARSLEENTPFDVAARVLQSGGGARNIIARGHLGRDAHGVPVRLRGVVIDVTRQRKAEEMLHASELRYRTLFEAVDEGVCIIEMLYEGERAVDYRFLEMNRAFVNHTGLEGAIGRTIRELVPEHDEHWFRIYGQVAATGEPVRFVDEAKAMKRWYDVYAARVGGADSRQVAILFADISARVAADAELRRLAADLSEADRRKTEFLATLAHELRNPLAPLRNGLQVMRLSSGDPVTTGRIQDIMDRQLSHMVALIDDLLDVSRITRGRVDLKREWIDIGQVLANAVETSLPLIEAEQHELQLDILDAPLPVYADPTRIRQVVSNLLNNAAKYTPRGGRIDLSARIDCGQLVIAVSDNGVGIDASSLDAVFDMFTQVGRDRQRARGGLGIGLSLVRSLVELHGGSVAAHSDGDGRGSVFTVRLPLDGAPGRAGTLAPATLASTARRDRLRILVVDDNHDAATTLAELLELIGHTVAVANDGIQALALAPSLRPQVIFLDIGMPNMDGYQLARAMRDDDRYAGALLVALTGWGSEADRTRTRDAGFDLHLTKPVNLAAVAQLLSSHAEGLAAAS